MSFTLKKDGTYAPKLAELRATTVKRIATTEIHHDGQTLSVTVGDGVATLIIASPDSSLIFKLPDMDTARVVIQALGGRTDSGADLAALLNGAK